MRRLAWVKVAVVDTIHSVCCTGGSAAAASGPPTEPEISLDEAVERATEVLGEEVMAQLKDVMWKERLQAMETINEVRTITK